MKDHTIALAIAFAGLTIAIALYLGLTEERRSYMASCVLDNTDGSSIDPILYCDRAFNMRR